MTKTTEVPTTKLCAHPPIGDASRHIYSLYTRMVGHHVYRKPHPRYEEDYGSAPTTVLPEQGARLIFMCLAGFIVSSPMLGSTGMRLDADIVTGVATVGGAVIGSARFAANRTAVRVLGGPHDGEYALRLWDNRVACAHGYLLSSLCDTHAACVRTNGPRWYTDVGELVVYTPPGNYPLPGTPRRTVDPQLAAIFRVLALVADDATVGGLAVNLIKLATALLAHEPRPEDFDELVDALRQQTLAAVETSSVVAAALHITQRCMSGGAFTQSERECLVRTNALVNKSLLALTTDGGTLPRTLADEQIARIQQELQAALVAQNEPKHHHEVMATLRAELEVSKAGFDALRKEGGLPAPGTLELPFTDRLIKRGHNPGVVATR